LTLSFDDLLRGGGAEGADELVLEVCLAHIEAKSFHVGASEVCAEAGPLERAPDDLLLGCVAEARKPDVEPLRAETVERVRDCLRTPDGNDGRALGLEISAAALGERFERELVADPFDDHDRARHDGLSLPEDVRRARRVTRLRYRRGVATAIEISAGTTVGAVHLTVGDLERSIAYYRESIGLDVLERADGRASLGAGEGELLVLVEEPGAGPAHGYTGLYHFALLLPQRADLARWLAHAGRDAVPLVGMSDHFVSEAIYLRDPDGHGIEIYCDRPRDVWEGQVFERMTTLPLDVASLMSELRDSEPEFEGLPSGTVMGHVHLKVAAISDTIAFYRDVLGFSLMAQLGEQAAFLAAGGYHHHIGANTWESAGASPAPPGVASLRHATIVLPAAEERDRLLGLLSAAGHPVQETDDGPLVRDPSGNALVLALA
jgi:catechol 2,3-dioxygenase